MTRRLTRLAAAGVISLLLSACQPPAAQLSGTVSVASPAADAVGELTILLTDITGSDEAQVISSSTQTIQSLPFTYQLPYEASKIDPAHRYTVSAQLRRQGVVRYATDTAYEVFGATGSRLADMVLVPTGVNGTRIIGTAPDSIFNGELRAADGSVTLYRAGFQQQQLLWIEEERSTGSATPLRARYELKGAYLMHYADSVPVEISFNAQGRPERILQSGKALDITTHHELIDQARNRAALLRSMVLANQEAQQHRQETESINQ